MSQAPSEKKKLLFYIVAPKYIRTSAGIRLLYELCVMLNELGHEAWMVVSPVVRIWQLRFWAPKESPSNPDESASIPHAPILTHAQVKKHKQKNLKPYIIYSETIRGNPLRGCRIIRYLLNFPGLLDGPKNFSKKEFIISYSQEIQASYPKSKDVLLIPSLNKKAFWFSGNEERDITCYYSAKYEKFGYQVFGLPKGCIEISRDKPDAPNQEQIGDLLRRSKVLYVFENSHIMTEAIMCGCPVVPMFNPFFEKIIGTDFFTSNGIAVSDKPEDLEKARQAIPLALKQLSAVCDQVYPKLREAVEQWGSFDFDSCRGFGFSHPSYRHFLLRVPRELWYNFYIRLRLALKSISSKKQP